MPLADGCPNDEVEKKKAGITTINGNTRDFAQDRFGNVITELLGENQFNETLRSATWRRPKYTYSLRTTPGVSVCSNSPRWS